MSADDGRYVSVTMAGQLTGIPERTLRRWVADGKLPAIAGQRGRLVALADVRRLGALTGRDPATAGHLVMMAGQSANVSDSLPAIPSEIIDELRAHIAELEQRIQQLEARDAAPTVDATVSPAPLRADAETVRLSRLPFVLPDLPPRRPWWRFWEAGW